MIAQIIFNQVDHPLIVIPQAVIAFYLFRLFFSLRRSSFPLPQMVGVLAFTVLANLTARATHKDWFWVADIFQYVGLGAVIIAAVYLVNNRKREAAAKPDAPVVVADFFDRSENVLTWIFGLIVAGIVSTAYVTTYLEQKHADAKALAAAKVAEAKATEKYLFEKKKDQDKQDSILTAIASISATQTTILANQSKNMSLLQKGQQAISNQVKTQNSQVKKTLQNSVIQARPIDVKSPQPHKQNEKPGLWNRVKGLFHNATVYGDSLSYEGAAFPGDTLLLY